MREGEYRDWSVRLAERISQEIAKERPDDRPSDLINRRRLAAILRGATAVVDTLANLDEDDRLGEHTVTIPVDGVPIAHREARFKGTGGLASSWDYVLRYRVALPERAAREQTVRYGQPIKVMHLATTKVLHSHALAYGHPGSSRQQQVTAFAWLDDNDWWRVKGPDGQPDGFRSGETVQHGAVFRLEHIATRRNLHSHAGFPSPVTGQQGRQRRLDDRDRRRRRLGRRQGRAADPHRDGARPALPPRPRRPAAHGRSAGGHGIRRPRRQRPVGPAGSVTRCSDLPNAPPPAPGATRCDGGPYPRRPWEACS